jgi:hypothetical protein
MAHGLGIIFAQLHGLPTRAVQLAAQACERLAQRPA